jgi:hypothetical protein
MGWLVVGHKRYYYRYHRVGKKIVSEYVGTGAYAEQEAANDQRRIAERKAQRLAHKAELARIQGIENQVKSFDDLADLVARASLVAAGYRQHDRGPWRKWRVNASSTPPIELPNEDANSCLKE